MDDWTFVEDVYEWTVDADQHLFKRQDWMPTALSGPPLKVERPAMEAALSTSHGSSWL